MGRRSRKKGLVCKYCGSTFRSVNEVNLIKTWHMVAPFPDRDGNISISVMALWVCPICGKKNRSKVSVIKGGENLQLKKNYTEELINTIYNAKEISLETLAEKFRTTPKTIEKAVNYLISKGHLKAKIENNIVRVL